MPREPVRERVLPSAAARIAQCSPQWIRYLVDVGRLLAERGPTGVRLIDRAAVEELARQRRRRSRGRCTAR